MDAGPILKSQPFPILPGDTTESLENILAEQTTSLLLDVLEQLPTGKIQETPQDDALATYCKIIKKEEGLIDWNKDAAYLERFVRAMQPWPTAYTFLHRKSGKGKGERMIIRAAEEVSGVLFDYPAGTIAKVSSDGLYVWTGRNFLVIKSLQKSGKAAMTTAEFLRGTAVTGFEDVFTATNAE
jgi:methionyl-tRNA formyltransferase